MTTLEKLIKLSKTIIELKELKLSLIASNQKLQNFQIINFNISLINTIEEIEHKINLINNYCKHLLNPFLNNLNFGHSNVNKWYFTKDELKKGYVLLESFNNHDKYILTLYHYKDDKNNIPSGTLIILSKIGHLLGNFKN